MYSLYGVSDMQQSVVSMIVFFYIFVSFALLVYNLFYMFSSGTKQRIGKRRLKAEIRSQSQIILHPDEKKMEKYKKTLLRRLSTAEGLLVFHNAFVQNRTVFSRQMITSYLEECRTVIFHAAERYVRRPAMERALFAYYISIMPEEAAPSFRRLGEILLKYLEDSTIYLRENVLKALCHLGNGNALEHALMLFQENGWYHNSKLITDALIDFQGDRRALAERLWMKKWDDRMRAVLIQFMAKLPDDFSDSVLPLLASGNHEICFDAIRYFSSHIDRRAVPVLQEILKKDEETAIAAAQVLGNYPDEETKKLLMKALKSGNWYIRYNAAVSLTKMGLSRSEEEALLNSDDRFAREMFTYISENRRSV